ncbi:REP element-mobilizing transposase RayT [Cnuella takakiae]|uniref:REP element-mobilizing transposase RayT n=1 Tax=Cnuella takakiae TaxID=1302690 RepID=A0A1M5GVY1_9BACT|nr:hypothetical protein [Cnuella takakiae]OLY90868.1 hypothetical protein BUE76_02375 [Cnuella takakiae]SHG07873.1 REP element-mobilizing transposase RayT [Cnuella takakiae]
MGNIDYHIALQPDGIYHVLNRANGNEHLFYNDENRHFFLRKFQLHVGPVADLYAWCLLPNHFHLLIQVKPELKIAAHQQQVKSGFRQAATNPLSNFIMERFSNWLNAYSKAFNKMYSRKGSLFTDYLRRIAITNDQQLAATLFYIHRNPVHHGCCQHLDSWDWSSYQEYQNRQYVLISPAFVQQFFGTLGAFKKFHSQPVYLKEAKVVE